MQTLWPDHCIQGTPGVEIERALSQSLAEWSEKLRIARKVRQTPHVSRPHHRARSLMSQACYPDVEAYSGFEGYITEAMNPQDPPKDPGPRQLVDTDVTKLLRAQGIDKVVLTGLATDFW